MRANQEVFGHLVGSLDDAFTKDVNQWDLQWMHDELSASLRSVQYIWGSLLSQSLLIHMLPIA